MLEINFKAAREGGELALFKIQVYDLWSMTTPSGATCNLLIALLLLRRIYCTEINFDFYIAGM